MSVESTAERDAYNNLIGTDIKVYSSREAIRSQLTEYAQEYLSLQSVDLYKTSYLSYTIDILSILAANQIFYSSMVYKEFFFVEAQLKESVYNLARWIGYIPRKASPSQVDIMFTIPLDFATNSVAFAIPNNFKTYADGIPFMIKGHPSYEYGAVFNKTDFTETAPTYNNSTVAASARIINNNAVTVRTTDGQYHPVYINNAENSVSFLLPFTQEEVIVHQFIIPKTLEFYQFYSKILEYTGMVTDVKIWVKEPKYDEILTIDDESQYSLTQEGLYDYDSSTENGGFEWTEAEHGLYTMSSTSNQFSWYSTTDKGELYFGNGVIGRQPKPGSKVLVLLYVTRGEDGMVVPHTITRGDRLYYMAITTGGIIRDRKLYTINYSVTNPTRSTGGLNIPTLPEIKNNAIVNLRSKKRLVSEMDYDDINEIMGPEYPVAEASPILKRSDIKINEIMVFNRLVYHDENDNPEIVPTRNIFTALISPILTNYQFTIPRRTKIKIDDEWYETLFNITIDTRSRVATYDYVISKLYDTPAIQDNTRSYYSENIATSYVYIPVTTVDFEIEFKATKIDDLNDVFLNGTNTSSSSSSVGQGGSYPLKITANLNHIPSSEVLEFRCYLITKWDDNDEYLMTPIYADEQVNIGNRTLVNKYMNFEYELDDYRDVPKGTQRFEYLIQGYTPLRDSEGGLIVVTTDNQSEYPSLNIGDYIYSWTDIQKFYTDVIIRQDLEDMMISTMTWTRIINGQCVNQAWMIHNIPTILSSYLDDGNGGGVYSRENQRNFENIVIQKLLNNMDMTEKRMLTDFINIKFPDTHGHINNMKYNPIDYTVASRTSTPFGTTSSSSSGLTIGSRYLVNDEINGQVEIDGEVIDGSSLDLRDYINFIAELKAGGVWKLIEPIRNTYVRVGDETDRVGDKIVLAYNNTEWVNVQDLMIPLNIYARIERATGTLVSDAVLIENVKEALMKHFMPRFGMNSNLDRSELIRTIRGVQYVQYCDLIEPSIDVKFLFELQDLTQAQLLDYTPQYVGFIPSSINIEILGSAN